MNASELLGWGDRIGSIEQGKFADIVATSSDPSQDITQLEKAKFVMKGGEVVRNELVPPVKSESPNCTTF